MKKTVVLDIDRTLVHSVEKYRLNVEWMNKFEWIDIISHISFLRPNVREFINLLFDKGYNVGIFTAGSREYAKQIVDELFKERKPLFIFSNEEYDEAFKLYGRLKPVEYIEEGYPGECILIDDSNTIKNDNPEKCYRIKPFFVCFDNIPNFNVDCVKDLELIECMRWLEENF
jgi:FMN phosphatase YigB (HAD superfamily)